MSYLLNLYKDAVDLNHKNISGLLDRNKKAVFLDLGCDDGVLTVKMAKKIGTKNILGIDIVDKQLKIAKKNKVKTFKADLNSVFPVESNTVDIIHANQVIEHIGDLDKFMSEIHRVLKVGGYAIVSTENASSWCNIFALTMGWQMFSLTNISSKALGIGNPFAMHKAEKIHLSSWTHKTIFSIGGLIDYAKVWGFTVSEVRGAGYFPLPATIGNIDKTHCHFMTIKIHKQ